MKFDIDALFSKLNKIDKELKEIDAEERRKKYGTFLDSKEERAQLYMTFSPSYLNAIVFCMIALGLIGIGMLFIFDPERKN